MPKRQRGRKASNRASIRHARSAKVAKAAKRVATPRSERAMDAQLRAAVARAAKLAVRAAERDAVLITTGAANAMVADMRAQLERERAQMERELRAEFKAEKEEAERKVQVRLKVVDKCAQQHAATIPRQYDHYPLASMVALAHSAAGEKPRDAIASAAAVTKLGAASITKELLRAKATGVWVRPHPAYNGTVSANLTKLEQPEVRVACVAYVLAHSQRKGKANLTAWDFRVYLNTEHGISVTFPTTCRYLRRLGFKYSRLARNVFVDKHELWEQRVARVLLFGPDGLYMRVVGKLEEGQCEDVAHVRALAESSGFSKNLTAVEAARAAVAMLNNTTTASSGVPEAAAVPTCDKSDEMKADDTLHDLLHPVLVQRGRKLGPLFSMEGRWYEVTGRVIAKTHDYCCRVARCGCHGSGDEGEGKGEEGGGGGEGGGGRGGGGGGGRRGGGGGVRLQTAERVCGWGGGRRPGCQVHHMPVPLPCAVRAPRVQRRVLARVHV